MKNIIATLITTAAIAVGTGATATAAEIHIDTSVGQFDAEPGDVIVEHYGLRTRGEWLVRHCSESGGVVIWDPRPWSEGYNAYACYGLDF